MVTTYILGSVLLVSLISLIGVGAFALREAFLRRILFVLVALAAGALLGNALAHLLPESYAEIGNPALSGMLVFAGMLSFFALEKFLRWHHAHGGTHDDDVCKHVPGEEVSDAVRPLGTLVLVADGIHNLLDGVIIAAAYTVSIEIGIATTIAIILHEIPQEIGDFGLLLHAGFSRSRALLFNLGSALLALVGAGLTIIGIEFIHGIEPYLVAVAAGGFLYIGGSDILPELHHTTNPRRSLVQFGALIIGALLIVSLVPEHEEHGEDDHATIPYAVVSE